MTLLGVHHELAGIRDLHEIVVVAASLQPQLACAAEFDQRRVFDQQVALRGTGPSNTCEKHEEEWKEAPRSVTKKRIVCVEISRILV